MYVTGFFIVDVWLTSKGLLMMALLWKAWVNGKCLWASPKPSQKWCSSKGKIFCLGDEIKSGGGGFLRSLSLQGNFQILNSSHIGEFSVFTCRHGGHVRVQNNSEKSLLELLFYYYAKLERHFAIVLYNNMAVSSSEWKPRTAETPFFPSSMNRFSVLRTCADLLNFACLFLFYRYRWYSLDIIAATLVHKTKEKIAFGNSTLLLCKTTWAIICYRFVHQHGRQVIEYHL